MPCALALSGLCDTDNLLPSLVLQARALAVQRLLSALHLLQSHKRLSRATLEAVEAFLQTAAQHRCEWWWTGWYCLRVCAFAEQQEVAA